LFLTAGGPVVKLIEDSKTLSDEMKTEMLQIAGYKAKGGLQPWREETEKHLKVCETCSERLKRIAFGDEIGQPYFVHKAMRSALSCGSVDWLNYLNSLNSLTKWDLIFKIIDRYLFSWKNDISALNSVTFLLNSGIPDIEVILAKGTIHEACEKGHIEAVRLMLERGVAPNMRCRFGYLPLHCLARDGDSTELLDLILSREGVEIDCRDHAGKTALHHAVREGKLDTVKKLVEKSADIDAIDSSCETPFHCAVQNNVAQGDMYKYFIENGAKTNVPNLIFKTPKDLVAKCCWDRLSGVTVACQHF